MEDMLELLEMLEPEDDKGGASLAAKRMTSMAFPRGALASSFLARQDRLRSPRNGHYARLQPGAGQA